MNGYEDLGQFKQTFVAQGSFGNFHIERRLQTDVE